MGLAFLDNDYGTVTTVMDKEITATQFKARCLRLLDEVAETGEPLVVTKHGRAVARVEPPLGVDDLRGSAKMLVSAEEFIKPIDVTWDAERK
jgi:prevent-host-death family protein